MNRGRCRWQGCGTPASPRAARSPFSTRVCTASATSDKRDRLARNPGACRRICSRFSGSSAVAFKTSHSVGFSGFHRACSLTRSLGCEGLTPWASSASRWALALMPRWKSARENFSLGPWRLSSFWPQPSRRVSTPSCVLEQADDGDRAPFADEDGGLAEARLDGADRGADAGALDVDQHGRGAVVVDDLVASRPGGQTAATWARNCSATVLGSWSGTSRKLSFAPALQGRTVLGPGPW